jgi:hypothetical protein
VDLFKASINLYGKLFGGDRQSYAEYQAECS